MSERPLGVSVLGVLYIIGGAAYLVLSIIGMLINVDTAARMPDIVLLNFLLWDIPSFNTPVLLIETRSFLLAYLLMYLEISRTSSYIFYGTALSLLLLPGTLMIFIGGGLLKMFNWARILALSLSIVALAVGIIFILVPPVLTLIGLFVILFNIIVLAYLRKPEVKDLFT